MRLAYLSLICFLIGFLSTVSWIVLWVRHRKAVAEAKRAEEERRAARERELGRMGLIIQPIEFLPLPVVPTLTQFFAGLPSLLTISLALLATCGDLALYATKHITPISFIGGRVQRTLTGKISLDSTAGFVYLTPDPGQQVNVPVILLQGPPSSAQDTWRYYSPVAGRTCTVTGDLSIVQGRTYLTYQPPGQGPCH